MSHPAAGQLKAFVLRHGLLGEGDRVLAAASGGPDSIALLYLLRSCFDLDLAAAHLNHGFRGAESDLDQRLVEETARSLGIPCYTRTVPVRLAAAPGESPEEAARRIRYRFFHELRRKHGYRVVATGHTLDDHIETMLFRLARGTGPGGLAGIKPRAGSVVHPMLDLTRCQVLGYLRDLGVDYRIDSSNYNLEVPRNRIRHQVVPLLESLNPGFRRHLARLSRILMQEDVLVDEQAGEALRACATDSSPDRVVINLPCYQRLTEAMQRRVVLKAAGEIERPGCLPYAALDRIVRHTVRAREVSGRSKVLFSNTRVTVRTEYQRLLVEKTVVDAGGAEYLYLVREVPGSLYIRELGRNLRCSLTGSMTRFSGERVHLDFGNVSLPLVIRNRREGDRITLKVGRPVQFGGRNAPGRGGHPNTGTRKLKDLFIDHKVPRALRDQVPVVETGGRIAAVFCSVYGRDNRVSDLYGVTPETEQVLVLELVPQQ